MRHNLTGWAFIAPAVILLVVLSIIPLIKAFLLSLQSGRGSSLSWAGFLNYARMLQDPNFKQMIITTFYYMIWTVPVMIILGILLAVLISTLPTVVVFFALQRSFVVEGMTGAVKG